MEKKTKSSPFPIDLHNCQCINWPTRCDEMRVAKEKVNSSRNEKRSTSMLMLMVFNAFATNSIILASSLAHFERNIKLHDTLIYSSFWCT